MNITVTISSTNNFNNSIITDFAEIISLDAFNKSSKSNEFVIGITIIKV